MKVKLENGFLDMKTVCYVAFPEDGVAVVRTIDDPEKRIYTGKDADNIKAVTKEMTMDRKDIAPDDISHIKHDFPSDADHLKWWRGEL